MFHTEFPNITWLREQISNRFAARKTWDNRCLGSDGWPSVILNVRTDHAVREGIRGPFSLFLNQKGWSRVQTGQKSVHINPNAYIMTNLGENYDLLIDGEEEETETLNIHFGEAFYHKALQSLTRSDKELLDDPFEGNANVTMPFRTVFRDAEFEQLLQRAVETAKSSGDVESEALYDLFSCVVHQNLPELRRLREMPLQRVAARDELLRRLFVARDYIHAHYDHQVSLDELADLACLSKFHFLRSFKAAFRRSPYQYIKQLRLGKALEMIRERRFSVEEIAFRVGLENGSSLSRMVHRATGKYPSSFR